MWVIGDCNMDTRNELIMNSSVLRLLGGSLRMSATMLIIYVRVGVRKSSMH